MSEAGAFFLARLLVGLLFVPILLQAFSIITVILGSAPWPAWFLAVVLFCCVQLLCQHAASKQVCTSPVSASMLRHSRNYSAAAFNVCRPCTATVPATLWHHAASP